MGRERTGSRSRRRGEREKETPAGCMSGFLQLFNLHQILFRATSTVTGEAFPRDLQEDASPRGVMAPRNSLKLEEVAVSSASTVTVGEEEEEEYDIPVSS
ncbi:unnamed protein product [Spirodela intermedia]|uniref:Uncharacterized protein n=2 Tax=Spirodela intermedia TaxID=51605 RepID=A0A7I8KHZ1_SPIIN|nr:unnamed protein product [Spirodela intermedia]CAA6660408.1 unnamed protein product [Spirodela intermedia]CAA7396754.1 unnamed protein product [Spirodela intermedia]